MKLVLEFNGPCVDMAGFSVEVTRADDMATMHEVAKAAQVATDMMAGNVFGAPGGLHFVDIPAGKLFEGGVGVEPGAVRLGEGLFGVADFGLHGFGLVPGSNGFRFVAVGGLEGHTAAFAPAGSVFIGDGIVEEVMAGLAAAGVLANRGHSLPGAHVELSAILGGPFEALVHIGLGAGIGFGRGLGFCLAFLLGTNLGALFISLDFELSSNAFLFGDGSGPVDGGPIGLFEPLVDFAGNFLDGFGGDFEAGEFDSDGTGGAGDGQFAILCGFLGGGGGDGGLEFLPGDTVNEVGEALIASELRVEFSGFQEVFDGEGDLSVGVPGKIGVDLVEHDLVVVEIVVFGIGDVLGLHEIVIGHLPSIVFLGRGYFNRERFERIGVGIRRFGRQGFGTGLRWIGLAEHKFQDGVGRGGYMGFGLKELVFVEGDPADCDE